MKSRIIAGLWLLLAAGALIAGLQAEPTKPENLWMLVALAVIVGLTFYTLIMRRSLPALSRVLHSLRGNGALFWFVVLLVLNLGFGWWVVVYQPTNGWPLLPFEIAYLCAVGWVFLLLTFYDMDGQTARALGTSLGKSRVSGLLLMLTTALVIFWAAEAYLRVFYITTDAYGFTAMNYHWYKNFLWGDRNQNSLHYRDYEPLRDVQDSQRVAVVGDSFAVGHGLMSIDDSFPQLLEKRLGAGWDVNLVATSGWDSDVQTAYLNAYYDNLVPNLPGTVILSYYLNDIDYLLQAPEVNPDAVFTFPENPTLAWFVLNFFTPNYAYYNLLQFTSQSKNINFLERLIDAHTDDVIWSQQAATLQQMIDWCTEHNARLIILLWPHITAVQGSQPATERVKAFFEGQGAAVVDMSEPLNQQNPADMILNRFDTHPNTAANRLAAEALHTAITGS